MEGGSRGTYHSILGASPPIFPYISPGTPLQTPCQNHLVGRAFGEPRVWAVFLGHPLRGWLHLTLYYYYPPPSATAYQSNETTSGWTKLPYQPAWFEAVLGGRGQGVEGKARERDNSSQNNQDNRTTRTTPRTTRTTPGPSGP